jgi:RNA polymerase sigma factor (sigma-70 family)
MAATKEAIQALEVHIAGLPQEHRRAVQLNYLQGRSLEETATALGRSPAAVRGLLYRAKQRLRVALGRSSRWFGR